MATALPSGLSVAPRDECRKKVMYSFTNRPHSFPDEINDLG